MMSDNLLDVHGVTKRFGGFSALTKVDLHVKENERFGLIGPNGSGKTTLINCISGALANDEGNIVFSRPGHHHHARLQANPHGHRPQFFRFPSRSSA